MQTVLSAGNARKLRVHAFHYAEDSRNFCRNSNGKVRFGFFKSENSGSSVEVVHLVGLEYSAVPFLTNRFFALNREFGKGIKSAMSHSYWLIHFPRVFPLISDRSVWHNGKQPKSLFVSSYL